MRLDTAIDYATFWGFSLHVETLTFVFAEEDRKLTIPVERTLAKGSGWKLRKSLVGSWDKPSIKNIETMEKEQILRHIVRYLDLLNKNLSVVD